MTAVESRRRSPFTLAARRHFACRGFSVEESRWIRHAALACRVLGAIQLVEMPYALFKGSLLAALFHLVVGYLWIRAGAQLAKVLSTEGSGVPALTTALGWTGTFFRLRVIGFGLLLVLGLAGMLFSYLAVSAMSL